MNRVSLRAVCAGSLLFVLLLSTGGMCKRISIPEAFMLLRSIRSPDQLVSPRMPSCYTVPISLSGTIADEMKKTLDTIHLEPPRYEEVYDKKHQFHLYLANQSYPLETRDMLAGVLNPVEMIDAVVSSVLKYRSDDQFITIVNETEITLAPAAVNGRPGVRAHLTPKGKYFAYAYDDLGPYIRESWLSSISCLLDTATHLVHELDLMRHVRTYMTDQAKKPPVDSSLLAYGFSYAVSQGTLLPVELSLSVNGVPSLSLSADYRSEGKYVVFATRKICYVNPAAGGNPSCLVMVYGPYSMNTVPHLLTSPVQPNDYAQHMEKAAQLCRKALDRLRSGNIESSIPLLKKIVSEYPETPQAVEARKLLSGLPGAHETPKDKPKDKPKDLP
jgi:hypothetical protein